MSEYITPKVTIPQRNISNELRQIYDFQSKYAAPYYNLNAQYSPLYNRVDIRNLGDQTMGFTDETGAHVPGTLELGRTAATYNRTGDVGDLLTLGPQLTGERLSTNPWLARSLELLSRNETPSNLLTELNTEAEGDLASKGYLSPETERLNRETTRSAWADRGLGFTDQAGIDELMNRENLRAGRVAMSRKFAGDVEGLNQVLRDYIGRATQIDATALEDPANILFNRAGTGTSTSLTPIGSGTKPFDPFNAYFQDYFSSNQNAAATQAVANAQAQANVRSSIATIAGGAIGSDIRMKEKIVEIGRVKLRNGAVVPRYEFEYRAGLVPQGLRPVRYRGVMSDDVEQVMPEAIVVGRHGFKLVNYNLIGIELEEAA
jgi:hypothetical protein